MVRITSRSYDTFEKKVYIPKFFRIRNGATVIGIWYGESKPILDEYLALFIDELEDVLSNGIIVSVWQT